MQNITIGRYEPTEPREMSISQEYAGWIEGIRDDGTTWIMWLDEQGSPQCFWANRESDGGVIGDAILLATPLR